MEKNTLNPSYSENDSTFDFNIYLSVVEKLSSIELIAWDKDTIGKEYLGEATLPLEDWFQDAPGGRKYAWEAAEVSQPYPPQPARPLMEFPVIGSRSTSHSCPHERAQNHKAPSKSSSASSHLRALGPSSSSLMFMPES